MAIRAVIFDIGGVLVRAGDISARRRRESELGLQPGDLGRALFGSEVEQRALIGEATEDEVWDYVGSKLGVPAAEGAQLGRDFWGTWDVDLELVDFLRELRPRYKTAVLSNAWRGAREIHAAEPHLDDAIDLTFFSAEMGVAKPDVRIFEMAAEQLGVATEEAIFVDDVPEYVEGARAAGMQAILFEDTEQTIRDVREKLKAG